MSHQTGIEADQDLKQFFSECKSKSVRTLAVMIKDEKLVRHSWKPVSGKWEDDYTNQVLPLLEEKTPRYVFFRHDSGSSSLSDDWLLLLWSPEDSPIRFKMLYASTKATLKRQFGSTKIKEEVFVSCAEDATLAFYEKYKQSSKAPAPLTSQEEELLEVKRQEVNPDIGINTKHQTMTGLNFPLSNQAIQAVSSFTKGDLQYVRLFIDLTEEKIEVEAQKSSLSVSELPGQVPETNARYHLYRFDHNWEGDYIHSVVFVYSMPGYVCPIKERMVYSSCTNTLTAYMVSNHLLNIARKIEIGEGSELTEEFLLEEIHPKQNLHKPKFSKPKGPAHRGNKRLTK
ncbi:Actin-depolymerizing factor domain, partial [Trinorchestia longiramus]